MPIQTDVTWCYVCIIHFSMQAVMCFAINVHFVMKCNYVLLQIPYNSCWSFWF